MNSIKPPSTPPSYFTFSREYILQSQAKAPGKLNSAAINEFKAIRKRIFPTSLREEHSTIREENPPVRRGSLPRESINQHQEFQAMLKKTQELLDQSGAILERQQLLVRKSSEDGSPDPTVPSIKPSRFQIIPLDGVAQES